jgi:hypothetical protein
MKEWWTDTDTGKSKCCFVHHKSNMDWRGIEPRPPRQKTTEAKQSKSDTVVDYTYVDIYIYIHILHIYTYIHKS